MWNDSQCCSPVLGGGGWKYGSATLSSMISHITMCNYDINARKYDTYFNYFNPLPAGAVHIRFLHFLLAHYISVFKPVKDKKWH